MDYYYGVLTLAHIFVLFEFWYVLLQSVYNLKNSLTELLLKFDWHNGGISKQNFKIVQNPVFMAFPFELRCFVVKLGTSTLLEPGQTMNLCHYFFFCCWNLRKLLDFLIIKYFYAGLAQQLIPDFIDGQTNIFLNTHHYQIFEQGNS